MKYDDIINLLQTTDSEKLGDITDFASERDLNNAIHEAKQTQDQISESNDDHKSNQSGIFTHLKTEENKDKKWTKYNDLIIIRPNPTEYPWLGLVLNQKSNYLTTLLLNQPVPLLQNKNGIFTNQMFCPTMWTYMKKQVVRRLPYFSEMIVGGSLRITNQNLEQMIGIHKV